MYISNIFSRIKSEPLATSSEEPVEQMTFLNPPYKPTHEDPLEDYSDVMAQQAFEDEGEQEDEHAEKLQLSPAEVYDLLNDNDDNLLDTFDPSIFGM